MRRNSSNPVNEFIDAHCTKVDSTKSAKFVDEFQTISEIVTETETLLQIGVCFEKLIAGADTNVSRSIEQSDRYREEGNRLFRTDKRALKLAACRYYTNAIFAAPEDTTALALAHANRAAALYEFGYFNEAYMDCCLAEELGYPQDKRDKLLLRRASCALSLEDPIKLDETLEKLRKIGLVYQFSEKRKEFEVQLKILKERKSKPEPESQEDHKHQNILVHEEKGRYMTASKDIQKDEMILSEKAFAFVPVNYAKICSFCGKHQIVPFPCYTCAKVVYCSLDCKKAHERIHDYECYGYRCDLFEALGIHHLAFTTLVSGLPEIMEPLCDCTSAEQIWKLTEVISKTAKRGYPEILALYTNIELLNEKAIRVFALGAIVAANYLCSITSFLVTYDRANNCRHAEWLLVISALILRHALQMVTNAQSSVSVIFQGQSYEFLSLMEIWEKPKHLKKRFLHRFRGIDVSYAGIFPYLSLCNHSCEPSVRLGFDGNRIVAKARKPIEKGGEILNSYILDCRSNPRKNRLEELRDMYGFKCECKHCAPGSKDEEYLKFHKYVCGSCKKLFNPAPDDLCWWMKDGDIRDILLVCPSCNAVIDLEWYVEFDELFADVQALHVDGLTQAITLFKYSEVITHGFSDLRQHMAWQIVISFFNMWKGETDFPDELFYKITHVLEYWLDHFEQQNDVESVLYATTTTFALDLMAEQKGFEFDLKKIRRSFDVLSTELRTVFENYIQDYIEIENE